MFTFTYTGNKDLKQTYYTKSEEGEFNEVKGTDFDQMFSDRRKRWQESESGKIREEVEASVREDLTSSVTKDVEDRLKGEYETKLNEATTTVTQLQTSIRQRDVAAEYGFKPEAAKYLGDGDEEAMRKEADSLKANFATGSKTPSKETQDRVSDTQERTGIKVTI